MRIPLSLLPMWRVAAEENPRYALNGVRAEVTPEGKARLIATDGRSLLIADYQAPEPQPEQPATVVPRDLVRVAAENTKRRLDKFGSIEVEAGAVEVGFSGLAVCGKSIEGRYPPVLDILRDRAAAPKLDPAALPPGATLAVRLSANVFGTLCRTLDEMGVDTVDFWFEVVQREDSVGPAAVAFCARDRHGEQPGVTVQGAVMPLSGLSLPIRVE